jgi:hypothetical protein
MDLQMHSVLCYCMSSGRSRCCTVIQRVFIVLTYLRCVLFVFILPFYSASEQNRISRHQHFSTATVFTLIYLVSRRYPKSEARQYNLHSYLGTPTAGRAMARWYDSRRISCIVSGSNHKCQAWPWAACTFQAAMDRRWCPWLQAFGVECWKEIDVSNTDAV